MSKPSKSRKKGSIKKEKKMLFQSPKGTHDILPAEQLWWDKARRISEQTADFYNYSRIDTPILEFAEIFEKSVGGSTDIVEKQMYYVKTKNKDRLALRPEGTAGIVRAYIEHGLSRLGQPLKLYYFGPFFRYESPQAGRYRQFYQVGFEILGGENDPVYDAQIILTSYRLLEELKIKNLTVEINSLGCKSCRAIYCKKLQDYYKKLQDKVCHDCRRRFSLNPLRLLDCKNENCQEIKARAPIMLDNLCLVCRNHFRSVLEYLDEVNLPYILNPHLVRGLDYYSRTVFEFIAGNLNFSLGGGGRYDDLGEMLGAKKSSLSAIGSGLGIERLIETIKEQGISWQSKNKAKIFLIQIGQTAKKRAFRLMEEFRKADIKILESLGKESLNSQLVVADKKEVAMALILGQKEVFEDSIIIRDMKSGAQETVPLAKVVMEVKKRL